MSKRSKKPECEHVVAVLRDVAEIFGISPATVKDWRRAGMPGGMGAYDLLEIAIWRLRRERERAPKTDANGVPLSARARREFYQSLREKLRYERESGAVVTLAACEREVMLVIDYYERLFGCMPGQLAVKLANKSLAECRRILKAFVNEAKRQTYGVTED